MPTSMEMPGTDIPCAVLECSFLANTAGYSEWRLSLPTGAQWGKKGHSSNWLFPASR
jgi:hypothetical protein